MERLCIDDLPCVIGPSGASDAVVGIPCGIAIGIAIAVIF